MLASLRPSIRSTLLPVFGLPRFALNLYQASLGFPSHPKWDISNSELIRRLHRIDLKKVPVQKFIYKELITRRFQSPLEDIFQKRISEAFHNYVLDFDSTILLRQCFCTLRKVGCAAAVKVLKGWCNGWATSRRFQERVKLPCVFGCCNEQDDLHHYLTCPHLYAIWSFLVGGVSSDPLIRWGLVKP